MNQDEQLSLGISVPLAANAQALREMHARYGQQIDGVCGSCHWLNKPWHIDGRYRCSLSPNYIWAPEWIACGQYTEPNHDDE